MYPCLFASLVHFHEFIWTPPKAIKRAPPNNGKKIHFSNHGVTGSSGFGISGVIHIPSNGIGCDLRRAAESESTPWFCLLFLILNKAVRSLPYNFRRLCVL